MAVYTSEITSSELISDNPVHQRLFFGYYAVKDLVKGDVLEVGCGTGRGLEILLNGSNSYIGLDKNGGLIKEHSDKYPESKFIECSVPPFPEVADNSIDTLITFHVIEHIKDHKAFVREIYRVLKPGGTAIVTTPNKKIRLARNPWHVREYTRNELRDVLATCFNDIQMKGIAGNEKVMEYYEENKRSVQKIMKFDFLRLQYAVPASWLRAPYEYMNRRNRQKLLNVDNELVKSINYTDYFLTDSEVFMDNFAICKK